MREYEFKVGSLMTRLKFDVGVCACMYILMQVNVCMQVCVHVIVFLHKPNMPVCLCMCVNARECVSALK